MVLSRVLKFTPDLHVLTSSNGELEPRRVTRRLKPEHGVDQVSVIREFHELAPLNREGEGLRAAVENAELSPDNTAQHLEHLIQLPIKETA